MNWLNDFYNDDYAKLLSVNTDPTVIHNLITDYSLTHNIRTPNSLIDFGCGYGDIIQGLSDKGYETIGVDASEYSINKCLDKGLSVIKDDFANVKLDKKFDVALSWNTCIGHISRDNDRRFISNVYQHLDDDGIFILMLAHTEHIINTFKADFTHNNINRKSELRDNVLYQTWIMNNKSFDTQRILYMLPELYTLLDGFCDIELYSYDGDVIPFAVDSQKILLVCRK